MELETLEDLATSLSDPSVETQPHVPLVRCDCGSQDFGNVWFTTKIVAG